MRAPQVAGARNKAERELEIAKLTTAVVGTPERVLHDEFVRAKQLAEAASVFCHAEVRYPLTGVGDVNTYALFAETMYGLTSPQGRAGVVLPTGIVTDDSTKLFFEASVSGGRLVRIAAYENEELVFPSVHHAFKFCLITFSGARVHASADLSFFARQPEQIHDHRRHFRLSAEDFRLINPNTRTCPIFRSAEDAELTKQIHRRVPVLIDETRPEAEGNPWGLSFMRMLDMASDSGLFLNGCVPGAQPLYEAKMLHQFDHRWATYEPAPLGSRSAEARDVAVIEKSAAETVVRPRYWVDAREVEDRLMARGWTRQWLVGWRDICRATDERTTIASVMPRVGVGHTTPLLLADADAPAYACLLANLNALVLDYVARLKVGGTHLTYGYLKQFPVLAPDAYGSVQRDFIVRRVLELTYTAYDLIPWARDLGHDGPPFGWDPARRAELRAELDAYYARLYGLTRAELRYVLDPADVMGADYPSETFRVLKQNEQRVVCVTLCTSGRGQPA